MEQEGRQLTCSGFPCSHPEHSAGKLWIPAVPGIL